MLESTLNPDLHNEFVTKYLKDKELENMPERDHTEVLNEQLQKAAEETAKTYKLANIKGKKTTFVMKNKKESNE